MSSMSAASIIVMAILLMAALAVMEVFIFAVGGRQSSPRETDRTPGDVRGGIHVGDPGSVSPRPDAPANSTGNEDHRQVTASQPSR